MEDQPAYIVIAEDGFITLYGGDGTDREAPVIWRGPRALDGPHDAPGNEEMVQWATENGYRVILPAYDLQPDPVGIDPLERDFDVADEDEIDQMLDDLYFSTDNEISDLDL